MKHNGWRVYQDSYMDVTGEYEPASTYSGVKEGPLPNTRLLLTVWGRGHAVCKPESWSLSVAFGKERTIRAPLGRGRASSLRRACDEADSIDIRPTLIALLKRAYSPSMVECVYSLEGQPILTNLCAGLWLTGLTKAIGKRFYVVSYRGGPCIQEVRPFSSCGYSAGPCETPPPVPLEYWGEKSGRTDMTGVL